MKKNYKTKFHQRQYMLSKDFEIYYYEDNAPSAVKEHIHNYYEFYFFLEGDVSIMIENKLYPINVGDILLIPPNVKHYPIIHSHKTPYRRFVFWISTEYCNTLLSQSPDYVFLMQHACVKKEYIFHNDIFAFNIIQSKVFRLIEEMNGDRFGRNAQISICVNDLILHLNRIAHEKMYRKNYLEETSLYQGLLSYIEEHLDENLTLEQFAIKFYVSKYYISHIFKNNMGISLHQYITKKRLYACKNAICANMSITQAYLMFGFGDYSSFYRAFKKEFGISPKEFREIHITKETLSSLGT
ncbi:AraC family transcriptional regulator [[Clostridium] polysaccharolyticum]|uniref:AraC-type DNA-binding protein n=1 Tax=[Clostridium] polysaccharolyticum TaxID=29364 RepID=A0A1I0D714_9FIRM|nr:AraC family transcriptional regulator [[Clostridium] polysaccharolyticum]SET27999.1 AraC-type DNA-binding protein [[Clostridium] polysaccharolyticum]